MVDDVKNITETAESKATADAIDRARLARERREAEQRKRLDELRAHAAAAQAQREKRDEDRRRRQAEQRAKDDDRRVQVEERKRAIWEASISRREALLQRERDRTERLERARAARSAPRPAFAFGSSTPRLLEPLDSAGFFWAARSTNPIDQMNFFESLAASTTNVMFASAPLTRRASALQLDSSDTDNKDEPDRQPTAAWSSVARRRTDLVPTAPAPRAPGRAYSMTRLDRLPPRAPHDVPLLQLARTQCRSGETTPGSRPGSALSQAGVVRRAASAPRRPRPASIAGTGVNTPRGGAGDACGGLSAATTPSMSRDSSVVGGDVPRRPATTPRRPRPASLHAAAKTPLSVAPGEGKPPVHRKPKPSKEHESKTPRGKSVSASPGRTLSPSPAASKEPSVDKELAAKNAQSAAQSDKSQVSAIEVTQKLEALQIQNGDAHTTHLDDKVNENKEIIEDKQETKYEPAPEKAEPKPADAPHKPADAPHKPADAPHKPADAPHKPPDAHYKREEPRDERKETAQEKTDDSEMTASMTARRITTEEQAKAALAERRRRAREELERQAELERQRLQREAEEEAERQRQEEERQRREEEEARELAALQRRMEEEKLRKAIEAQQQLEREESSRRSREEAERRARLREEEDKRRAAEEAERLRREEAEREERERLARKQRVEAIMARTRLKKAEEEKKQQEIKAAATAPPADNGNAVSTGDLLGINTSQVEELKTVESQPPAPAPPANNGNLTADLLGLSQQNNTEDTSQEQSSAPKVDNAGNNGNVHAALSASLLHAERRAAQSGLDAAAPPAPPAQVPAPKLLEDEFASHNGHGAAHPLTLQNAI